MQKQITIQRLETLAGRKTVGPMVLQRMAHYLRLRVFHESETHGRSSIVMTKAEAQVLGEQLLKFAKNL